MMATQLADAALIDPRTIQQPAGRSVTGYDSEAMPDDGRLTAARGIVTAVLISTPFWALIAFTVYLLL